MNSGYHITNKSYINSILKNGLVPNIGKNSRSVREQHFLVYFTTFNFVDTWIKRFNLDRNQIVILKFPCNKFERRYDSANDFFILDTISPENISVIDNGEEISLVSYYEKNKLQLDSETEKNLNVLLKNITERLQQIEFTSLEPEEGWNYNETEPNLIDILEMLKIIRSYNNKEKFVDILNNIKSQILKILCANNLEITTESEIYRLIDTVFIDSLSDNPKFDFMSLNLATILLSVDLFYRQLERYNKTGKKYGDENTIWNIDTLYLDSIYDTINNNCKLKDVMEEIIMLHSNKQKNL